MKKITLSSLSFVFVAAFLVTVAAPAYAEDKENPYVRTREMIKKDDEAIDKEYKKTLNATKGAAPAAAKVDPWTNMRTGDPKSK
jgi:hypothetical protein